MSTQDRTLATNAHRFWPRAIKSALKRIRYRQRCRTPSTAVVDQATQTSTWPSTAMSTAVVDKATQTPTWANDQQQFESQEESREETEQTGFQFMDLPLELRREVYRHYINNLPPLMYTSPQICREVADVTDRVVTFQFFNGLFCPGSLKYDAAELAAVQLASLYDKFQGENIRLRIELQCPSVAFSMVYYYLKALMDVVEARELAPVEVYMTKGEVCSMCARHPHPDPVKFVRESVERVERLRDGRAVRYGVQSRCGCRGRRLE
ncbi:hypothetical protein KCU71_g15798, partial [Aureobasidium melanogenum]